PLRNDIQNILHYVEQLNQLDTDQVEPLAHPGDIVNALRKDLAQPSLTREELLKNSPKTDGEFYLVPAVLGEPGKS
ncbi:MAG: Asp-tRNA(Asn)/Glu-tRNA(Gln) amidotransferase subunit GatC, partial [Planctomycetota bacterium]|nr:Asp-tRNA(Asn)/Glu-tRNA(Gln) amidotransferase subunit GatC [Planctomycetota bacterium]